MPTGMDRVQVNITVKAVSTMVSQIRSPMTSFVDVRVSQETNETPRSPWSMFHIHFP